MSETAGPWPGVSYVMPVLNEEQHVEQAIRAVLDQAYPGPSELIVALGPSHDRTDEIVGRFREAGLLRTVSVDRAVIPRSLNRAIAAARHPIVVRVDAHAELPAGYTRRAVRSLLEHDAANVGGVMLAVGSGGFQSALADVYNSRWGLGGGAYHLAHAPAGEAESVYLGVFRAADVAAVGGYDESIGRGEDWELNHRLLQSGRRVWLEPSLQVTYRPRTTVRALAGQQWATGAWRAELVRRLGLANGVRYFVPPALVLVTAGAVVCVPVAAVTGSAVAVVPAVVGVSALGAYAGLIGALALRAGGSAGHRARFALALVTTHYAWGAGFLSALVRDPARVVDRSRIRHLPAPHRRRPSDDPAGSR